jgi:glycosyltransferase involved in cell wall biosynthesis
MIRIVFAIGSLEIGGAEKQVLTLLRLLKKRDNSCYLFVLGSHGPLEKDVTDLGIPVYSGGLLKGELPRAPWKLVIAQWRLLNIIRRLRPDVIHSFLPLVSFMGALAGRLGRVPLVITSRRALGTHQERFSILRPMDLLANYLSHRVTVNSKAVWNDIVDRDHIHPSRLQLIYNGVDPVPFEEAKGFREKMRQTLGVGSRETAIIVIANLILYKGHADLFEAAKQVIERVHTVKFLLVGEDRGIQRKLERKALDLGVYSAIRFLGQREDVPQLLAASDLSVLPSHEEGFSNVILESMAAGLPVVATCVGGNPEAIEEGSTGWLVPPRNPTLLAEKIVDILKDPERKKSFGKRGKDRVKQLFSVERMLQGHLKLYSNHNKAHRDNKIER